MDNGYDGQDAIATTKVRRAAKIATTGVRVGTNYLKHYARRVVRQDGSRETLHEENARDIYDGLSELKGSALKVLQMMSLDKNLLPAAYVDRFSLSQFAVPPLSYPLVVRTFRKWFGKAPEEMFDSFDVKASNAASIGQVHRASKGGRPLAVKVQYPGVAESVDSDLRLVRPFAVRLFSISDDEISYFFDEVRDKLLEETDYVLELRRSIELSDACRDVPGTAFVTYHPEWSCPRVITMDWMEGTLLADFIRRDPPQETRDALGQAMWDLYHRQAHVLRRVNADPHPGNFIVTPDGKLGVIDFGCVKEIDDDFYYDYYGLLKRGLVEDAAAFDRILERLEFFRPDDTEAERALFRSVVAGSIGILSRPFRTDVFDFGDDSYFLELHEFGDEQSRSKELRASKTARGPRDGLYLNRTYFGLFTVLNRLRARVRTTRPEWMDE